MAPFFVDISHYINTVTLYIDFFDSADLYTGIPYDMARHQASDLRIRNLQLIAAAGEAESSQKSNDSR